MNNSGEKRADAVGNTVDRVEGSVSIAAGAEDFKASVICDG